jgi:hypothetical protein
LPNLSVARVGPFAFRGAADDETVDGAFKKLTTP